MTNPNLSSLLLYFRACYQADLRAIHLLNFFGKKVEHPFVLEDAALLEGKWEQIPVDTTWAKTMYADLAIYAKEKALYCMPFFLMGHTSIAGRNQEVFAPLLIIPATLQKEDEIFYLRLQIEKCVLNPAAIDLLKANTELDSEEFNRFVEQIPRSYIRFDEHDQIEKTLQQILPTIQLDQFEYYPKLMSEEGLKAAKIFLKKNKSNLHLLSAIGLGLVKKSIGSMGIVNELEQMAKEQNYSKAIQALFQNAPVNSKPQLDSTVIAPITLSESQTEAIQAAQHFPISLINGPPGTGKSFTIAALATDFLAMGKTVLIAAKNSQAVEVIANKIEKDFGLKKIAIRANRSNYRTKLKKQLHNLKFGIGIKKTSTQKLQFHNNAVNGILDQIQELKAHLLKLEAQEQQRGLFIDRQDEYWFKNFRFNRLKKQIVNEPGYWESIYKLEDLLQLKNKKMQELIQTNFHYHAYQAYLKSNREFRLLRNALKAKTGNEKDFYFDQVNFTKVLNALPIWLVNTSEIHQVLPFTKELFDVVVIDEASQCDMASALPLLQRAKQAVIVGDPKQLRHVSFLSQKQQLGFQQQLNINVKNPNYLNYREKSLIDFIADRLEHPRQITFLNEHYRSLPDIIHFSNQYFYNEGLRIMTANPNTINKQNVYIHNTKGHRRPSGYNKEEAQDILEQVQSLIKEEALLTPEFCQSIGILSPFRAQVDYIRKLFRKELSPLDIERHQILIGTPHAFQGEERDIMFLSFVIDNKSHPSIFQYLNKEDVFNVSITRARSQQYIFLSLQLRELRANSLLAQYVKSVMTWPQSHSDHLIDHHRDYFMEEVIESLQKWGIKEIYQSYPIAGLELDLVFVHQQKTYCIDLIGYPGNFTEAYPIERWKILERLGIRTFALPYSRWYIQPRKCQFALRRFIGISPKNSKNPKRP